MSTVDWKYVEGNLQSGMVIKLPGGEIAVVDAVTRSSAQIRFASGYDKAITTRKGITKLIIAHRAPTYISVASMVQTVDPQSEYARRIRERVMSETETITAGDVAEVKEKKQRASQVYTRTEKQPEKELKGQGALVLAKITEMGSGTIPEVAEALKGQFQTRQSDERVVGFYLSKFKREGYVSTAAGSQAETETEATEQPE
jgi:hypothetical protein